ncbi:MAG TPA: branched-chain amino acid ABC transporter permease [Paracoccaceae bacterium]|nr:branched-chain amino acid ABC transporter permease [Paracoccaceae bacterium]
MASIDQTRPPADRTAEGRIDRTPEQAAAPSLMAAANRGGAVATAIVIAGLAAMPWVSESFFLYQMTQLLVYAIAILGLNMLTGISGQFSLGHGAFYGIGAYTAAILIERAGVHYALTLPVAGGLCFAIGFLFALPAHRLEGVHLALATFALAVATPQILKLSLLEDLTGGVQGITVFPATFETPVPFGLPLPSSVWTYYVVLVAGLLLYRAAQNIVDSRTGRALLAIRDNPIAARAMGVDLGLYKATAFGISALITGVAGALGAMVVKFVAPDSFTFFLSILLFVGLVVGGVGWLPGCLIGAAAIIFLPNFAEGISKGLSGAFYGLFLILIIYLAPEGAGGLIRALRDRIKRSRRRPATRERRS